MSKVLILSRTFPSYHKRKGEPTHFVEKFLNSLPNNEGLYEIEDLNPNITKITEEFWETIEMNYHKLGLKLTTIRRGNRFKTGDKFSPRVWSGKPYRSKMIKIAKDVVVFKTWEFEIKNGLFYVDGKVTLPEHISTVDGFKYIDDFLDWFRFPNEFKGQVISWKNINI